jgi:nicotinamidase/pyrazinamidase
MSASVLLIVDMQNDFMPGGALGVSGADACIPIINQLIPHFSLVLATQDWHPADHLSFVTTHPGKQVGDIVMVEGIAQILWPVHCVRSTHGSELVPTLNKESFAACFFKGTDKKYDSYSAFFDNARRKSTGLADYLQSRQITRVFIAGVATEYCVLYTALDALDLGFKVSIIEDACRGINLQPRDIDQALALMRQQGAEIIKSSDINNNQLFT